MSDPTDNPLPHIQKVLEQERERFELYPYENGYDRVAEDAKGRADGDSSIVEQAPSEGYYAALDAAAAYAELLSKYQKAQGELEHLKSLESYKAQEARIRELEATNRALAERTRSLEMTLPTAKVEALEQQLRIARKANHLEDLQAAEKRIVELEQKLEELNG